MNESLAANGGAGFLCSGLSANIEARRPCLSGIDLVDDRLFRRSSLSESSEIFLRGISRVFSPGSLSAPSKLVVDHGLILILTGLVYGHPNERDRVGLLVVRFVRIFREERRERIRWSSRAGPTRIELTMPVVVEERSTRWAKPEFRALKEVWALQSQLFTHYIQR